MTDESLEAPDKVRELQIKLYRKAKSEPGFRFYQLYDKVYRTDVLLRAWTLAKANDGAPGVDGQRFEDIESEGVMEWLNGLGKDLREKTYWPSPVRRVMIEKEGGGERPLGIPTIRDRVAQTAAKLILEPIFEADLEPGAYGYRPKRMRGAQYRAHIVKYADDFVILSRGKAAEALEWVRGVLGRLKLTLNEKKTGIRNARNERFDFPGYQFGPHYSTKAGRRPGGE